MEVDVVAQSFLDTSVLRSLLLGSETYKKYLREELNNRTPYVSKYIQMEIRRSFLLNLISFYFVLRLPTISTLDDAISFWNNQYRTSKLKALIQFTPALIDLINAHKLSSSNPDDKDKILYVIGLYIKQFERLLRKKFPDIGKDATRCTRALIPLNVKLDAIADGLKQFLEEFEDTQACREKCRVSDFLLVDFRLEVEEYVQQALQLKKNQDNQGFVKVAANLQKILEGGAKACSCSKCEKIGDAVIALDAPRTMQLEHIDRSFNYLCPPIGQPHCLHPSENQIIQASFQDKVEEPVSEELDSSTG